KEIGTTSIRFHALRACFATHLLSHGIASTIVQKICGWENLKTMERYVRFSGINEKGATDCLKIIPQMSNTENIIPFQLPDIAAVAATGGHEDNNKAISPILHSQ